MTNPPNAPQLEYAFSITLRLDKVYPIADSPLGADRVGVYLTDGQIDGPRLKGKVIEGSGGDWALRRQDGVLEFDARYMLQADDGAIIYLQNRGFRWGSAETMAAMARREEVDPDSYYFRVSPKFEAPAGPHEWLTRHVLVGRAVKTPTGNVIHYYVVL